MSNQKEVLKRIIRSYATEYKNAVDKEWSEAVQALQPGETAPLKNGIHKAENRIRFDDVCSGINKKIAEVVSSDLATLEKQLATAPTSEAVNALMLFKMRSPKSVTQNDILRLLETYANSPQTFDTIKDIASEKGYRVAGSSIPAGKIDAIRSMQEFLAKNINRQAAEERQTVNDRWLDLMCQAVDEAFPDTETAPTIIVAKAED